MNYTSQSEMHFISVIDSDIIVEYFNDLFEERWICIKFPEAYWKQLKIEYHSKIQIHFKYMMLDSVSNKNHSNKFSVIEFDLKISFIEKCKYCNCQWTENLHFIIWYWFIYHFLWKYIYHCLYTCVTTNWELNS